MAKPKEIYNFILAQHIQFNAVKRKLHNTALTTPHSKLNEPPLPVSIDLFNNAKIREKSKAECLNSIGLSMSYRRVLETQQTITRKFCEVYNKQNLVCPPSLKKKETIFKGNDYMDVFVRSYTICMMDVGIYGRSSKTSIYV